MGVTSLNVRGVMLCRLSVLLLHCRRLLSSLILILEYLRFEFIRSCQILLVSSFDGIWYKSGT